MLRSDLCDYSDTYVVVKGVKAVEDTINAKKRNKVLDYKSNALFRSCISKINNRIINNAEDLNIVTPMYNLLEYGDNYSMTSGSFWNYYRDEVNVDANADNCRIDSSKTVTSESFEYKTKII